MSKASPAGRSWPRLPDLDLIASQARLIIRHSCKFTAAGFLQFLLSPVVTGLASLNQIAGDLKHRGHPGGARQPLHPRCNIRSTAFLTAVLGETMKQHDRTAATQCRLAAMRAAPQVSAARRAERRQKARDGGQIPCPQGLLRDGRHLMPTNLSREQADCHKWLARQL